MNTLEPFMTYLGKKGWRSKAGRYLCSLTFFFSLELRGTKATVHVLFSHAWTLLHRWWRGKELQRKFERSTTGCRGKEKRGDCSKEPTPRFPHLRQCFGCTTSALTIPPTPIYPWSIIQILIINLFNSTQLTLVRSHSFFFLWVWISYFCSSLLLNFSLSRAPSVSVWMPLTCLTATTRTLRRCQAGGFLILKSTRCTFHSP